MKKFLTSRVFAFLLGALLFSGITGVAAYNMFASNVGYTPEDTSWEVDNVSDAIDDLYLKVNDRVIKVIAEFAQGEGNTSYSYTVTEKGTLIIYLFSFRGNGGSHGTFYCKKNNTDLTASKVIVNNTYRKYSRFVVEVEPGDVISLYSSNSGTYGDVGYSIYFVK